MEPKIDAKPIPRPPRKATVRTMLEAKQMHSKERNPAAIRME
jgi:hypothetical protein